MLEDSVEHPSPDPFCESASKLLSDWRKILCRVVDEAESFTRKKPVVGLTAIIPMSIGRTNGRLGP